MNWNTHYVKTDHAFLGASKWHWINYDEERLKKSWDSFKAVARGTQLHAYAEQAIKLGIRQKQTNETLNKYINDAIGFGLTPEQLLYYSDNCFGTADAIGFNERKSFLRIHDLKTGVTPAHMEQLRIYAALFCLEYGYKPGDIECELRIYQNDEVIREEPMVEDIAPIMSKIITFDKIIKQQKELYG
jgi:hypothetical protein